MASRAEPMQGGLSGWLRTAEHDRQRGATKAVPRNALYPEEGSHLRIQKSFRKKTWRSCKEKLIVSPLRKAK